MSGTTHSRLRTGDLVLGSLLGLRARKLRTALSGLGIATERMRTLAAEVWAAWTRTLLEVRHTVSRVMGGIPEEAATSVSFTTYSPGPLSAYSLPVETNITEACASRASESF